MLNNKGNAKQSRRIPLLISILFLRVSFQTLFSLYVSIPEFSLFLGHSNSHNFLQFFNQRNITKNFIFSQDISVEEYLSGIKLV